MKEKLIYKVSIITIIVNFILTIIKILASIFGLSASMFSDAIHSASDVLSTVIVMIGVFIANKKSDKEHQYGHERYESLATLVLAVLLGVVGIKIGLEGINTIVNKKEVLTPSIYALIAALVSIIVKEIMYQYTAKVAKKVNSPALLADAWHHRSDALSSIGSFVGILGSMLGYKYFDAIASIIIALFIIKVSYDILKDSLDKLLDKAVDKSTEEEIVKTIKEDHDILTIDDIKTRTFGSKIFVDLEIGVSKEKTFVEAHEIAERMHLKIEKNFDNCKHCMIHVNPK